MDQLLTYPYDNLLKNKKSIKEELLRRKNLREIKLAILSGSAINEVAEVLEIFLLNSGLKPVFWKGGYNRFYEDVMFPDGGLSEFKPDVVYLHTTARNMSSTVFDSLREVWDKLERDYHCVIIQNNFEMPCYAFEDDRTRTIRLNRGLREYAEGRKDFYISDIFYLSAYYGLEKWYDPICWHRFKYALDIDAIPLLAGHVAGIVSSVFDSVKKCLVLDLDDTLWGGVVGETGPEGIELGADTAMGEAYSEFQRYVKRLHKAGVLLAVCSRNDERTAMSAFAHPEMILNLEDISVFCANWESKADNVLFIAESLNILPDAIVFIDDNQAEQELLRKALPEVTVPRVRVVADFIRVLEAGGYFNTFGVTAEDSRRNEYYKSDVQRNRAKEGAKDYCEYLRSLEMTCEIAPFSEPVIDRVAQLISKTNQFNLTAKHYTRSQVGWIMESSLYITAWASLTDKFGSNGIVSAFIGEIIGDELRVEQWVMSCRVFKRDLELAVFDYVAMTCQALGIKKITGYYVGTKKNMFVAGLYDELGFYKEPDGLWTFTVPKEYKKKNNVIKECRKY